MKYKPCFEPTVRSLIVKMNNLSKAPGCKISVVRSKQEVFGGLCVMAKAGRRERMAFIYNAYTVGYSKSDQVQCRRADEVRKYADLLMCRGRMDITCSAYWGFNECLQSKSVNPAQFR